MDIYPSQGRKGQEIGGNHAAIRNDYYRIWRVFDKKPVYFVSPELGRLKNWRSGSQGNFLDGGNRKPLSAATRTIRLGHHRQDLEIRFSQ